MENNILENMDSVLFAVILLYFSIITQNKKRHASLKPAWRLHSIGGPGGIRTPDLLVRSQTLYPAELRSHISAVFQQQSYYTGKGMCCQHFFIKKMHFFVRTASSSD